MDRLISKAGGMPQQGGQCLCQSFKPSLQKSLSNSLGQILAAMVGGKGGDGQGSDGGYALYNDEVSLYGPNVELAGEQAGGRPEPGQSQSRGSERVTGESQDPALAPVAAPGRVRLQPDAKFPLRYRDLVGEYFKAIADTEAEDGGKK
jgi:hypothetical protein